MRLKVVKREDEKLFPVNFVVGTKVEKIGGAFRSKSIYHAKFTVY